MSTLLDALTTYLETELNSINTDIEFDMGYLFERDEYGFHKVRPVGGDSFLTETVEFVPCMFGSFTGDFNKPLNWEVTKQLSKGGSTALLFSLPDTDDVDGISHDDVLNVLEIFENRLAGRKNADGSLIKLDTGSGMIYELSINTSPGQGSGVVKYGSDWRVLFALTISIKAGIGITYGESIKQEIKRFGADDSTYVVIETPAPKSGIATAMEYSQPNNDKETFVGGNSTTYNKSVLIYYPAPIAVEEGEDPIEVPGRDILVELFRRVADINFKPDTRYTIRETYPDFPAVRHFKYVGGTPNTERGLEVSAIITFAPYKEITQ